MVTEAVAEKIHSFAVKWLERYCSSKTTEKEIREGFREDCISCDFETESKEALQKAFFGIDIFDSAAFFEISGRIDDIELLGKAIFSKWEKITSCASFTPLLSRENRPWFITAFSRLAVITMKDQSTLSVFKGEIKEIKIGSYNLRYGLGSSFEDEMRQSLQIQNSGELLFRSYSFDWESSEFQLERKSSLNIDKNLVANIFKNFARFFKVAHYSPSGVDTGFWDMSITNTQDEEFFFRGVFSLQYQVDGLSLSDLIRDAVKIRPLFVLDGEEKRGEIQRIAIDYLRENRPKTGPLERRKTPLATEYKEKLIVDRKTQTIELIRKIGPRYIINNRYFIDRGVTAFLESLQTESFFRSVEGNPKDAVDNPCEIKNYVITVDFKERPPLILKGSFDKKGLPTDWPEFAESLWAFISFFGLGEILDPSNYGQVKRRASDYIFCSVRFNEGGKSYYYLAEDDSFKVGDLVLVPVGQDPVPEIVRIVKIEYFPESKAPYPLGKIKRIIRKCKMEDFEFAK